MWPAWSGSWTCFNEDFLYGLDLLTNETTPQGSVTYTYDNASRRATMTVAGQTQIVYGFDNADRLTTITQGTSQVTIGYDNASRRTTVTYPNTNSLLYGYNDANDLTSLTYKQGATTVGDLTYTYDLAGRRTTIGGTFARATLPPVLTTTSYNANNQQLTFGTNTETYDFHGNLATVTDASGTSTYTWNVRNQLTGLSATGFAATFSYDSFGRRTGKTVQGVTTNFLYDGLNPVQEKNGATVTANLLTGLGIDEFFTRTDGAGVRALLPDALGSTVALGDGTGTLQTQYTYEPFGFATQTGVASTNSYKYTGREEDGTGLMYYRARYYHPRLQRFISEDPIGFAGGDANLYGYVRENPLYYIDPSGECPWCVAALLGGLTDLGVQLIMNGGQIGCVDWRETLIAAAASGAGVGIAQNLGKVSTVFGGPSRPTYRFFEMKGIVRVESHPISSGSPNVLSYPHVHADLLRGILGKHHLPLIEPIVGGVSVGVNVGEGCGCQR